jgi:hypothetical protein
VIGSTRGPLGATALGLSQLGQGRNGLLNRHREANVSLRFQTHSVHYSGLLSMYCNSAAIFWPTS